MIPGSGRFAGERIGYPLQYSWASLVARLIKNLPAMQETWVQSLSWEDPLGRERLPTPVFRPGEFHGLYSSAAAAKSLQPCPTLCDPVDGSPPGSSVPGILQARILEWVAISFFSCIVHGVSKSQTRLSDLHFDLCRWIQVSLVGSFFSMAGVENNYQGLVKEALSFIFIFLLFLQGRRRTFEK